MRILITGASGFIGGHLIAEAESHGHNVIALSRLNLALDSVINHIPWRLGELPDLTPFLPIDAVVHLAHDFDEVSSSNRSVDGTLLLFQKLKSLGVARQVFISSYSAGRYAESAYGRLKWKIELAIKNDPSSIIVRPGMVLGDGGIFSRIASWVRTSPIVPLPDGGKGKVPIVEVGQLCRDLILLCEAKLNPKNQEFNAFEEELVSLRDLTRSIAAKAGKKVFIFPIPLVLLLPLLRAAEYFGINLPVSSDNLIGFKCNQVASHRSSYEG